MTAATSLSRLEPNIPRAYFDYALRSVIRTRDAIVDATAPFQREQRHLWRRQSQSPRMLWLASSVAGSAGGFGKYLFSFQARYGIRCRSDDNLVGLASESLQNAESFCRHAISFRFGFRIRPAAGQEEGYPAMKSCSAVDKTISRVEQLL